MPHWSVFTDHMLKKITLMFQEVEKTDMKYDVLGADVLKC